MSLSDSGAGESEESLSELRQMIIEWHVLNVQHSLIDALINLVSRKLMMYVTANGTAVKLKGILEPLPP